MQLLVCPVPLFGRLLEVIEKSPQRRAALLVGSSRSGSTRTWLGRDVALWPPRESSGSWLGVELTQEPRAIEPDLCEHLVGRLSLSVRPDTCHTSGVIHGEGGSEPLEKLALPGPGMREITCTDAGASWRDSPGRLPAPASQHNRPSRWLRSIGALGGEAGWRRLTNLRVGIVGCGRTGSLIAQQLAHLGVRELVLIDPDVIEVHNLGEMVGVRERDLRRAKVDALADFLHASLDIPVGVVPVASSIIDGRAATEAKSCSVLFSTVDADPARLATTILCTLHHIVHIDIGTGVFVRQDTATPPARAGQPYHRLMGADVRLILPGDGCLRCRGGLVRYHDAVRELCALGAALPSTVSGDRLRAGSSAALNAMATSLAVHLLLDLVADRLRRTLWLHLDFDQAGHLTVQYPLTTSSAATDCPLCARAGAGEELT